MDYKEDPLYKKFLQSQSNSQSNNQQEPDYRQDPLYKKFKDDESGAVGSFFKGFTKNFDEYASSVNKGLDYISDSITGKDTKFFEDNQKYWNKQSKLNDIQTAKHPYARLGGEIVLDPINFTPAGVVSKGQKLGKIGTMLTKTKPRAIATSMGLGAGIGYATTSFKNYGNDELTQDQKDDQNLIGAGIVSAINGIIAGVTRGKVTNAVKPEMVQDAKNDEDIANAILNNADSFGLNSNEAEQVVREIKKSQYPKVDEKYKLEKAGFGQKYTPNFQMRPNYPPVAMDIQTALNVLRREANRKRVEKGLKPIYPEVQPQYRQESIYPKNIEGQQYNPNFVSGDFNNNIPVPYNANAELMQRYQEIAAHPRLQELLKMRSDVSAKDAYHPNKLLSSRQVQTFNNGDGWEAQVIPASYEKNYNSDFHLTKQDVSRLNNGKFDNELLTKLETDLNTLDNHPDYAKSFNSEEHIDYSKFQEPEYKPMSKAGWEEANAVFAKGIDNLAVGTYAGINEDENGNITFDPEKFILGLGGYTAVKAALKNDLVRGELKNRVMYALDMIDLNPAIYKKNGINAMSPVKMGDNSSSTINDVKETLSKHRGTYKDIKYTKENWDKIFPNNIVETPLGKVKLGENQFEKLDPTIPDPKDPKRVKQDRRHHLSYIEQTLKDPAFAIKKDDGSKLLYFKEIENSGKLKQYSSIMIDKDGMHISISSHPMNYKQIKNEISKNDVVYIAKEDTTNGATNSHSSSKIVENSIIPQKDEKDLLIHHNLTQDNLKFADENGGLAVPSLATTKKDNPIDGFGDVTMIGDEALAKPSRDHKVFGADIYSPRYPQIKNKLKARDERNIVNELQPYHEKVGRYAEVDTDNLADDIGLQLKFLDDKGEDLSKIIEHDRPSEDALQRYEALKGFYEDGLLNRDYANNPKFVEKVKELLKAIIGDEINDWSDTQINRVAKTYAGEMKNTARKLQNGSTPDYYKTRSNVTDAIGNKYKDEYKQFVRDYYKSHGAEEKIYNGTDNMGRQKWMPHTLDNVVKKLKKELRGGENFNYGTGSLRAKFTPQFKTLAQVRKAKDKLVSSEDFEKVENEIEDEYFNLKNKFQEHHSDKSFSFENTFNGLIEDSIKSPIERELKDYGFKDVPKELIEELENFKEALREMPTEYFESKVLRAMDLGEFKHAIIPNDASEETKAILKKHGIDYTTYDKNLPNDRVEKIKETAEKNGYLFANAGHNMAGGFAGGADSLINQRDYNQDGEYDYKDLLAGVVAGTVSINALKKLAPKLFDDGLKDSDNLAGMFVGSKGEEKRAFSDVATKKTMKEIDGGGYIKNPLKKSSNTAEDDGNIADKAIRETVVTTYKALDKAVEKVVGSSITDAFNKVKDTDIADDVIGHKIYEKKDYMKWREEALRERAEKGYELENLHKQLAELSTDVNKKLYDYMTGNKDVDLNEPLKKLGDKFINDIDTKGAELVNQGILTRETYETWKGQYLKRTYGSKLGGAKNAYYRAKGKALDPVIARGKIWKGNKEELQKYKQEGMIGKITDGKIEFTESPNGQIQFRRDWTPNERASMGEIKDASFAIPLTISKLDELVAHSKLLNKVAGKYVLSGKQLENLTEAQIKDMGYTKLSGERYGSLNGKWVDRSVANDIQELDTQLNGVNGSLQSAISEYFKWYKSIHTIYNPKTHINNIMSNIIGFSFMDGKTMGVLKTVMPELKKAVLPTSITTKAKTDALMELEAKAQVGTATKDELKKLNELKADKDVSLWKEAKLNGLFGQNHLNDTLNSYLRPQVKKVDGALNKIHNKVGEVYQFEDDIVRYALFKQFKKTGLNTKEAIKKVGGIVPDYSNPMSKTANWLRRYGVAPFVAFPYYGTPIMMKQIAKRPTRPLALGAMVYGLYMASGIDPLDEAQVPERFSKSYVPVGKNGDKVYGLKYDRWIPHLDLLKLHKMPLDLLWGGDPYISALGGIDGLVEGNGGYSPYFNSKITHKKGLEGRMDVAGSLLTGFITPDIADGAYGVLSSLVQNEKRRRRNKVYNPKSTSQNILNTLGLNTTSYNKSQQRKKYQSELLK